MHQFHKMNRRYKRISYLLGTIAGILLLLIIILEFASEIVTNWYMIMLLVVSCVAVSILLMVSICIGYRKNTSSFNAYLNSLVPEGYTFETGSISCEDLILETGYETKKEVCATAKLNGYLSDVAFEYYFIEFYKMREIIKTKKRNAGLYLFKGAVDCSEEKYIVSFDIHTQNFLESYKCYKGNTAYIYSQKEVSSFTMALPFSSFFISIAKGNVYMIIFDESNTFEFSHMHRQEEFLNCIKKKICDVENMFSCIKEIV